MEPQVKYRNMFGQVGLVIITFGIYTLYWFYQTAVELKGLAKDQQANPALLTVLLFIPFGAFYSYYKYAELYEMVSPDRFNRWILWLLWLFFSPAVWLIVQIELNRMATYGRSENIS